MTDPLPQIPKAQRLRELDALRGLAAMAVVVHHYLSGYDWRYGHSTDFPWRFDDGQYGVHLFFIISGFVILMTLERTRTATDFIVSRFARLYPAYWVAVIFAATLLWIAPMHDNPVTAAQVLVNLTMFQHALGFPNVDGVFWTLSVELFFYGLMLALWCVGWLRHTCAIVALWIGANALWAFGVRNEWLPPQGWAIKPLFLWEFAHLFAAGMLFYRVRRGESSAIHHALIGACLVMQTFHSMESWPWVLGFFAVFYLFVYDRLAWMANRVLVFFGTISYGVYLIHQTLGYEIIAAGYRLSVPPLVSVVFAVGVTLMLATVVAFVVERPVLAAVRGWWKKRIALRPGMRKASTAPS